MGESFNSSSQLTPPIHNPSCATRSPTGRTTSSSRCPCESTAATSRWARFSSISLTTPVQLIPIAVRVLRCTCMTLLIMVHDCNNVECWTNILIILFLSALHDYTKLTVQEVTSGLRLASGVSLWVPGYESTRMGKPRTLFWQRTVYPGTMTTTREAS